MKQFVVILAICVASAVAGVIGNSSAITLLDFYSNTRESSRIISGSPAAEGQFPWQVAVFMRASAGTSFCGGALISDQWVLTAAHCVQGFIDFTLLLGGITLNNSEQGRITVRTATGIVHSDYSASTLNNDIALLWIENPVTLTEKIQPIQLAARDTSVDSGVSVVVSGWGRTSDDATDISDTLNWVEMTTITNLRCGLVYGSSYIISSTLCATGNPEHSTCNGDSGGPLITFDENGEAIHQGIVSFIHINGCASGNPSGYVRTASFLDWIAANTGLDV